MIIEREEKQEQNESKIGTEQKYNNRFVQLTVRIILQFHKCIYDRGSSKPHETLIAYVWKKFSLRRVKKKKRNGKRNKLSRIYSTGRIFLLYQITSIFPSIMQKWTRVIHFHTPYGFKCISVLSKSVYVVSFRIFNVLRAFLSPHWWRFWKMHFILQIWKVRIISRACVCVCVCRAKRIKEILNRDSLGKYHISIRRGFSAKK